MSGIAMVTGEEGMPPIRAGVPIIDRTTALHAAIGTLAALQERERSGEGQCIDVCLADTGYSYTEIPITAYHGARRGTPPGRVGGASQRHVSLQGRLGVDFRRRPAPLAPGLQRPGPPRMAGRPPVHHPPRAGPQRRGNQRCHAGTDGRHGP